MAIQCETISSIIKQYIIMSTRFKDRFQVTYNIPEHLMDTQILKMTLQPLVENSIYHRFENSDSGGIIEISGRLQDDYVVLTIYDNGSGMPDCIMKKVHDELNDSNYFVTSSKTSGIGIINIDRRIKLLMGSEYGIFLLPANQGTEVEVRFPKQYPVSN